MKKALALIILPFAFILPPSALHLSLAAVFSSLPYGGRQIDSTTRPRRHRASGENHTSPTHQPSTEMPFCLDSLAGWW